METVLFGLVLEFDDSDQDEIDSEPQVLTALRAMPLRHTVEPTISSDGSTKGDGFLVVVAAASAGGAAQELVRAVMSSGFRRLRMRKRRETAAHVIVRTASDLETEATLREAIERSIEEVND